MGSGIDRSLEYRRYRTNEYPKWSYQLPNHHYNLKEMDMRLHVIGFCGKTYPFFEMRPDGSDTYSKEGRGKIKLAFSVQDIDSFVKSHLPDRYDAYMEGKGFDGRRYYVTSRRDFIRDFEFFEERRDKFSSHFDDKKIPVFFAPHHLSHDPAGREIQWNAPLKDHEFHRVIDSYQAFQQIAMWLANQAVPIKPIPQISNNDMIESKGFDLKFSFRKPKSK